MLAQEMGRISVLLTAATAASLAVALLLRHQSKRSRTPVLAATWKFGALAVEAAARELEGGGTLLDAVEKGINVVERDTTEQYFVGVGGLPNRDGDMQMDAALWDGATNRCGAVMALEKTACAVSVARLVLERSIHNVFVGAGALTFKRECGVADDEPLTPVAAAEWAFWRAEQTERPDLRQGAHDLRQHDTIGMVGVDAEGHLVAGTST